MAATASLWVARLLVLLTPLPPMGRPHIYQKGRSRLHPSDGCLAARKDQGVSLAILDHREFEITVEGGCRDRSPHRLLVAKHSPELFDVDQPQA